MQAHIKGSSNRTDVIDEANEKFEKCSTNKKMPRNAEHRIIEYIGFRQLGIY